MMVQWRAPVRQAMCLNPQHGVVIPAYEQEWHHSTIVELIYVAEAPEFVACVTLTTADWVRLVVRADRVLPLVSEQAMKTLVGAPCSYRVRWEPHVEQAYLAVWQQMADDGLIVFDQLIIGERRVM